jgi:hypothetical protein
MHRRFLAALLALALRAPLRAADLPDGTLLFLENCSSVVERATHGQIAHVAIVLADDDRQFIYEATPA